MPKLDIPALRQALLEDRFFTTTHAERRMALRKVTNEDIKRVVRDGDVIEERPRARPFPKALFMDHVKGEPLYVSCAFDGRYTHIITVFWHDSTIWVTPWTRRRKS